MENRLLRRIAKKANVELEGGVGGGKGRGGGLRNGGVRITRAESRDS